jgi:hypothetical protein
VLSTTIKSVAFVATIIGALLTAFQFTPLNIYVGNVGSLLYATWAWRVRDFNIMYVNLGLLIIYGSGTVYYHHKEVIDEAARYVFQTISVYCAGIGAV